MEKTAQRRKDKDIGHLPESHDKSKLRDDRKKCKGIDRNDKDLDDTKRDPDLKNGSIRSNNTLSIARNLVHIAKEIADLN